MIDITQIKHPQAVTISTFVLMLIVPVPTYLFFFDPALFNRLDIFKLLLASIAISGLHMFTVFIIALIPARSNKQTLETALMIGAAINMLCVILFFTISASVYLLNYFFQTDVNMPIWNMLLYLIMLPIIIGLVGWLESD